MNKETIEKTLEIFYEAYPIVFDGKKHLYTLNDEVCAGISSVADYAPKDYLKFWAAKLVSDFLSDKLDLIKTLSPEQWVELLLEAKNQHAKKSKDALDIGTKVHEWIEKYINLRSTGAKIKFLIEDDVKNPIEQFLEFEKRHDIQWILNEKIVASPKHLVAGTLDSLAMIDGKLSLVDLKTSNRIDEGYFLQTAGYAMCLDEMGVKIDQRIILRLPKGEGDGFEAILVNTPLPDDIDCFLHRRYSWKWNNMVDSKYKEEVVENGYKVKKLRLIKL
jgi:hypothetical protein